MRSWITEVKSLRHIVAWRTFTIFTALAAFTLVTSHAVIASANSSVSAKAAALKPDFAFFKGKTIHYLEDGSAGSVQGNMLLAMLPSLEKRLGAQIDITYTSAYVSVPQDMVAHSPADGLTIGQINVGTSLVNSWAGTGQDTFSLGKVSWVGSAVQNDDIFIACSNSSFKSFSQVIKGNATGTMLTLPNTTDSLLAHYFMAAWHIPRKLINYATNTDLTAGCERGDGSYEIAPVSSILTTAGNSVIPGLKPLLLLGPVPKGMPSAFLNKKVPTLAAFAAKYPPATKSGKTAAQLAEGIFTTSTPAYATFGPAGIPKTRLLALQDAFAAVGESKQVKQAFIKLSVSPGWVAPDAILSFINSSLKRSGVIKKYLNQ